jgi:hypothetical protein
MRDTNADVMSERIPTFEEWVTHCFSDPLPAVPWDSIPSPKVAEFICELFERPQRWLQDLSAERINTGLWFLLGPGGFIQDAPDKTVPSEVQARWISAVKTLYRDVFAVRCTPHLRHGRSDSGAESGSALSSVAYIFWDFLLVHGGDHPSDAIFEVLAHAQLGRMPGERSAGIGAPAPRACRARRIHHR